MHLWPMNENQTFLWINGMFECMMEVNYQMGPRKSWHLYDVASYNSVVFEAFDGDSPKFACGYESH